MTYHNRMMNIQVGRVGDSDGMRMYRIGHRDARHAAAEIANEADAKIESLTAELVTLRFEYEKLKESEVRASQADLDRRNELDELAHENLELFQEVERLKRKADDWQEVARNTYERLTAAQTALTEANGDAIVWYRKHRELVAALKVIDAL